MAPKTRKISTLIEQQLPGFISSEYVNFSKLVEKYYEQLESVGQPVDIISNITKYRDIDFYEENLLNQSTNLINSISTETNSIEVEDATSFPKENGYIRINNEICFYKSRTDTEFLEVSRGVSGNTTLGDLYSETTFVSTESSSHNANSIVYNVSNLFLYAFIKNFESQYLGAFPEKYLKGQVDKRTLIKNISKFYKAKGTNKSIKFIFNSIVSRDSQDIPEVYNPKDFTIKSSTSDWLSTYSLKVKVLSGNPLNLIGERLIQELDETKPEMLYASAVVDNVLFKSSTEEGDIYEIILDPSTINGVFEVASKTTLRKAITTTLTTGQKINVGSTLGWNKVGKILIGSEIIKYNSKNATQFVIDQRGNPPSFHPVESDVYSASTVIGNGVRLLTLGILYNLIPNTLAPYSEEKDSIQISDSGFETRDPIIFNTTTNSVRWIINENNTTPSIQSNLILQNAVSEELANVSAIYEDDQYYYICSSGYPSHEILSSEDNINLVGTNLLRLIRKTPTTTTEVYQTGTRDVGVFVDGTLALNHKDSEFINFGKLTKITLSKFGTGYKKPPFVLINNQPGKAIAALSGEVVESININTEESFDSIPAVTITSGRGAKIDAIVTSGKITSLVIRNPGEYYSSPPVIRISDLAGKGKFADYKAVISSNGQITGFEKIDEGKFYTKENVVVDVIEDARGTEAQATAEIEKWYFDRLKKNQTKVDDSYGYVFETFDSLNKSNKDYLYGRIANPIRLRVSLSDNLNSTFEEPTLKTHSPIIGFAYDGVPIYGPFGYSNPVDPSSTITRLFSGYQLKTSRFNGPSTTVYPLGTFVEDYEWKPSVNTGKTHLDENNGRFCVTPDYPNGVYAYFLTVDSDNIPIFPYILGKNYYSLPVDSNYNSNISQNDIPVKARRLKTSKLDLNGNGVIAYIESTTTGGISSGIVEESHDNFKVGSIVRVNSSNTGGSKAGASVSSVVGKNVISLESKESKATEIKTIQTAYYFEGDTITQPSTGASGILIGDVINSNQLVLRSVIGSFEPNKVIESTINVINLVLSQNSSFTAGKIVSLFDGINAPIATGLILETTNNQNSLKLRVISGNFIINDDLFLKSNDLNDTVGSKIITINSLSLGISPTAINENIAIVETSDSHGLRIGDKINIDINPDDSLTETEYYVRKRYYQKITLKSPGVIKKINDLGVGRLDLLNSGVDYTAGTYNNIELIFQDNTTARENIGRPGDSGNAKATIVVSGVSGSAYGGVVQILITDKGNGYRKGDILTVSDDDLARLQTSISNQRLTLFVDHVGFARENTILKLNSIVRVAVGDLLLIGNEIVKVNSVNEATKTVSVLRGQNNTRIVDHYNRKEVTSVNSRYRFTQGQRIKGTGSNDPYVYSYDENTQELVLSFDYSTSTPNQLIRSNTFYDTSTPQKLVTISSADLAEYRLEFSKDNINFEYNPVVQIQKYYKYKFDVSHFSMFDTYLDFSSSLNYNLFTEEKFVSNIPPGNPDSYLTIKLGFGPNISSNTFEQKKPVNFTNYFYFIKVSDVNTQNSYLQVVDDSLVGEKNVIYSTDTKFVYNLFRTPEYDGTGQISYTTSSKFAIGKINSIVVENFGENYKRIPTVYGIDVAQEYEATVGVTYDSLEKKIKSITVIDGGKNYSKPAAIVVDGDGSDAEFEVLVNNGSISRVIVVNEGKNYSYVPTIKIIETDVKLYFTSTDIGVPQTVNIVDNGYGFHSDKTLYSEFKSPTVLLLENIPNNAFAIGEKIVQYDNGAIISSAIVSANGYRQGSNILRIEKIIGVIDENLPIKGLVKNNTSKIKAILSTSFVPDIKGYFDNQGRFSSDRGKIGVSSQKITDSFFYQDYSYVIKSKTSINNWRDLIKETVHPAGFKLFGEVLLESDGNTSMPSQIEDNKTEKVTFINLGAKNISVIGTKRYLSETVVNFNSFAVERGLGSISVDTFDNSETVAGEFVLSTSFNGRLDSYDGQPIGDTIFTMIDKKSGLPFSPYNEQQLIITIDGVLQEPGKAYTVDGTQITFAYPPFGENVTEGQEVKGQKFYGRYFKFKNNELNSRYLKKLKSLEKEFDGINTEFDLYYEDGSIVKTDINENLIITLNAVVQKAKYYTESNDSFEPFKNSYYILRSENFNQADKIVFSNPPIKHNDIVENTDTNITDYEKSFGYTIGSYVRLKINTELIPFKRTGPFLIIDEIEERVKKIDNPKYALVFIDGILQVEKESYNIIGSTITFTKPLNYFVSESGEITYPDVNIILLYGRDIAQSLTVYDFERDTFYNKLSLHIVGQNAYNQFINWYGPVGSKEIVVYQDNIVLGKLRRFVKNSTTEFTLILSSQTASYDSNLPLKFTALSTYNNYPNLTITGSYEVFLSYEENEDGDRTLSRASSRYLYGSELADKAWYEQTRSYANLLPGDLIKIDGENSYREIIQIPYSAKTKDYRSNSFVSNNIYSKVRASNYNDIVRGEGLSILAKISEGKVVSLEWNRRELDLYFKYNFLLQPTAYQYFTPPAIHFIPTDKTGGGARAEVIVYNGQVVDVVLLDGGSGYQEAPLVTVARGFDIVKEPSRKIDSLTKLNLNLEILGSTLISSSIIKVELAKVNEILSLGGRLTTVFSRNISAIIQTITNVGLENKKMPTEIYVSAGIIRPVQFSSVVSASREITNIIDIPFGIISNSTIASIDREITKNIIKIVNNAITETAPNSINDIGAFLDLPLSETDTIVYIADTRRFPDSGRLLIGKEIVTYDGKLIDRFLNVVRGAFGTTATTHEAGDYLRHLPELVSIVPVGPTTSIITEVTITEVHTTNTSITRVFSTISDTVIEVSVEDDTDIELTNQKQIEVNNTDIDLIKQVTIIPPTTYVTSLNSYSSTFVVVGVADSITSISSFINTLQYNSIELTNQKQIEVDNTDIKVIKQVTIIPPTSFNIITQTHRVQSHTSIIQTEVSVFGEISITNIGVVNTVEKQIDTIYQIITENVVSYLFETIINFYRGRVDENGLEIAEDCRMSGIVHRQIDSYCQIKINNAGIYSTKSYISIADETAGVSDIHSITSVGVTIHSTEVIQHHTTGVVDYLEKDIYSSSYTQGNAGFTLNQFENNSFVDSGLISNNISVEELSLAYPDLTIEDFELRTNSSITLTGRVFNLTQVSIVNPVVKAVGSEFDVYSNTDDFLVEDDYIVDTDFIAGSNPSTFVPPELTVEIFGNTSNFPDSGFIFTGSSTQYSIIRYTGKTDNSFTGCTLIKGSPVINSGNDIIPYSV
jgi:hypothetical protein